MSTKKELLVQQTNEIMTQYTTKLTLRQIFYRLVSTHTVKNTVQEYKYLSSVLVKARMSGEVPFDSMEDRTRSIKGGDSVSEYDSPNDLVDSWESAFRTCYKFWEVPHWKDQENHVEIWLEKEALSGLFGQTTDQHKVRLATCRGYPSLTFMYEACKHLKQIDLPKTILYFGDFDPSGMDIERHIQERLYEFGVDAKVIRIGITREQIDQYNIPPMPTKKTDARSASFMETHGDIAVELDALDPDVLQQLIKDSILEYFDEEIYNEVIEARDKVREELREKLDTLNLDWGETDEEDQTDEESEE